MAKRRAVFVLLAFYAQAVSCGLGISDQLRVLGPQAVNFWKLQNARARSQNQVQGSLLVQEHDYAQVQMQDRSNANDDLKPKFAEHWFYQPLDHFPGDGQATETWGQRYWINTRHYVPGQNAPVIVIDGGETSGEDRLGFLDTGIADILARATGGIGVVLEHRCVVQFECGSQDVCVGSEGFVQILWYVSCAWFNIDS